jgi:16S rRNA G1207 methylase RsmC
MTDTTAMRLNSPFGSFALQRRPPTPNQPLQAWDATDEYLLAQFAKSRPAPASVLVINDLFGALAIPLSANNYAIYSWSDSSNAHLALAENCALNGLANNVTLLPASVAPTTCPWLPPRYDVVLWRIPKSLALFQQQIAQLQSSVDEDTLIVAGGMIKHLPEQSIELLRQLGRVDILHAQKKARLFTVTAETNLPAPPLPANKLLSITDYDLQLGGLANVFARDKFDIGARFFIEQLSKLPMTQWPLSKLPASQRIADLGCGNGVLGIMAKRLQPSAEVYFFDESYQAVASAADNYRRNIDEALPIPAQFHCDDCLSHYRGQPFDTILCNPPFHQNHAVGDQIAWRMFTHSKNHLRNGGELWIVGNRHLQYHIKLQRIFGNCRQIAANPKFVILAATKTTG